MGLFYSVSFLLWLFSIIGWVMNLAYYFKIAYEPNFVSTMSALDFIGLIGIIVAPAGAFIGWFRVFS